MYLRVHNRNRKISLWVPLFIIFPIMAALILIMTPLILMAATVLWFTGWGRPLLMVGPVIFSCLCALRGLEIDVKEKQEQILISFR